MSEHVEERCPLCNSGMRRDEPEYGKGAHSFSCGTVFRSNGDVAFRWGVCVERAEKWLRHQLTQAQDQLQLVLTLLAKLLRGLEWSGWDERFRTPICPVCGEYKSNNKHFPDCDLNKALSFLRDVERE